MTSTRFGLRPLVQRDPDQKGRGVTNLELLFDLVFAAAVGVSSAAFHESAATGDVGAAVGAYAMVFFAIWWAWINFTWFATMFDNDDWLYRVLAVVQMAGSIVVAAGANLGIVEGDFTWVVVGYVILRAASIVQWIRVAIDNPHLRTSALRYAVVIAAVQVLWIVRQPLLPEELQLPSFLVMVLLEVSLPIFARHVRTARWNGHHVSERFAAFTIILLGESVLGSVSAVVVATGGHDMGELLGLAATDVVILVSMWWFYFAMPRHGLIRDLRSGLVFGYGHFVVFAAAGAFASGVENVVSSLEHPGALTGSPLHATLTIPVVVFIVAVWLLVLRHSLPVWASIATLGFAAVIVGGTFSDQYWIFSALGAAGVAVTAEISRVRAGLVGD